MELIRNFLFYLLFTVPLFNSYNFSYILVSFFVIQIIFFIRQKEFYYNHTFCLIILLVIVQVIPFFFVSLSTWTLTILQAQISLLLLIVLSTVSKFGVANISKGYIIYIVSSMLSILFVLYYFFSKNHLIDIQHWNTLNHPLRESIETIPYIGKHIVYFSLIISISILISIYKLLVDCDKKIIVFHLLNIGLSSLFLILLTPKTSLTFLFLSTIYLLFTAVKLVRFRLIYLLTLLIITLSILNLPLVKDRFLEYKKYGEYNFPYQEHYNSISIRNAINKCIFLNMKQYLIIGTGIGRDIDILNNCYATNFDSNFYISKLYNEHNQYAAILLRGGIFGLLLFLFSFYSIFRYSNTLADQQLYIAILIVLLGSMLTENIIDRSIGSYIIGFIFFIILVNKNAYIYKR